MKKERSGSLNWTEEEKKLKQREKSHTYYLKNKEKVLLRTRERYQNNKEENREYARRYREKNKEKIIERNKQRWIETKEEQSLRKKTYRKNNYALATLQSIRHRARRYNIPFDLSVEDIQIHEFCPVLGFPLVVNTGSPQYNSISVDRIDPDLGYVKGNVQVMSFLANSMKRDASKEQLLMFAKWVQEQYGTMD